MPFTGKALELIQLVVSVFYDALFFGQHEFTGLGNQRSYGLAGKGKEQPF